MRCNWLRWLWGLLPLGLLIGFTYTSTRDGIQADVQTRAAAALQADGLDWASTRFDGRDGTLRGLAYADDEQVRANAILRDVWGVRVADDRTALIEQASEFVWSADRDRSALRLTGFVPNARTRKSIIDRARQLFPGASVIDEMKPARGAPPEDVWLGGVQFGLVQLARLEPGASVNMREVEFAIDGRARSVDDFRDVSGALAQAMPNGVTLQANRVRPPRIDPYTSSLTYDGARLTMSGHAPSDADKAALAGFAKTALPSASLIDRMSLADGAPAGWRDALRMLLDATAQLSTAEIKLVGPALTVTGLAEREETAIAVGKALDADMPDGMSVTHDIKFVRPMIPVVEPYTTSIMVDDKS
ncbi:MAG: hypothetical protein AAFR55_06410, partial [Pseudomonadota bacterium]